MSSLFHISNNQVFQAANSTAGWSWPLGIPTKHFLAVSVIPDSNQSSVEVGKVQNINDIAGSTSVDFFTTTGANDALFHATAFEAS